ncbi:glycosyltransferase family 4 protein [bacterium]|nr:glycosyltransferase family 4 protein [bacterium]
MSSTRFLVLALPQLPTGKTLHPGGQLTAASGLLLHLSKGDLPYVLLNTVSSVFPPKPFVTKLFESFVRLIKAFFLAFNRYSIGYLAFSGFGPSLYERCLSCLFFKLLGKPSGVFIRSSEILDTPPKSLHRIILSLFLGFPSYIFTQGSSLSNSMISLGCTSVHVIPNWLPPLFDVPHYRRPRHSNTKLRFLFVGWIHYKKGIFDLLQAVNLLKTRHSEFTLNIAGNGSQEEVELLTSCTNSLPMVTFHGWIPPSDISSLMCQSDVLVLPSYSEGFPNVILEAMSIGLPIISTEVGAVPDSVINGINGYLVDIRKPQMLAKAMTKYLDNPSIVFSQSSCCLDIVKERHSRSTNIDLLLSYFI